MFQGNELVVMKNLINFVKQKILWEIYMHSYHMAG